MRIPSSRWPHSFLQANAQDQFRPMPGLISSAGVTGSGRITYHVYLTLLSSLKMSCAQMYAVCNILYIYMYMYCLTSFITSRSVCVYSCSQLRDPLWFTD